MTRRKSAWAVWQKLRDQVQKTFRRNVSTLGPELRVILGKPFSALALVERDAEAEARHADGATWYQLEPGRVYPAILRHIEEALDREAVAPDGALAPLWSAAGRLPREAWQWARIPKHKCPAEYAPFRAQALEIARLWFTELLHREHSGIPHPREGEALRPLGVHLLRDEAWRL